VDAAERLAAGEAFERLDAEGDSRMASERFRPRPRAQALEVGGSGYSGP
jgi:hypothetical protein